MKRSINRATYRLTSHAAGVRSQTVTAVGVRLVQGGGADVGHAEAGIALLLVGSWVLAHIAEHPEAVPVIERKEAVTASKAVRRSLKSRDAERAVVFLAHALLALWDCTAGEEDSPASFTQAREDFNEVYPLSRDDLDHLVRCETSFRRRQQARQEPDLVPVPEAGLAAAQFVCLASTRAIVLARRTAAPVGTITGIGSLLDGGPRALIRAHEVVEAWAGYVKLARDPCDALRT